MTCGCIPFYGSTHSIGLLSLPACSPSTDASTFRGSSGHGSTGRSDIDDGLPTTPWWSRPHATSAPRRPFWSVGGTDGRDATARRLLTLSAARRLPRRSQRVRAALLRMPSHQWQTCSCHCPPAALTTSPCFRGIRLHPPISKQSQRKKQIHSTRAFLGRWGPTHFPLQDFSKAPLAG